MDSPKELIIFLETMLYKLGKMFTPRFIKNLSKFKANNSKTFQFI
jgi:hypothetical protein